jgi:hypothetical protein
LPTPYSTTSAFFHSIGINTHLNYAAYSNVPLLVSQIKSLGIKHLRDGFHTSVTNQVSPNYDPDSVLFSAWHKLGDLGAMFDVVLSPSDNLTLNGAPVTSSVLNQLTMESGMLVESFEGANEMDNGTPVGWNGKDVQWQQALYPAVKSMAQVWQPDYIPLLGPSLANPSRCTDLGDLSHWLDFGSIHCYSGGNMPSVVFPSALQCGAVVAGTKPLIATECGFYTSTGVYGGITESASGRYMPRMFLLNFLNGIVRTYSYELLDDPYQSEPENSFGLIRADGSCKPSFYAVKNLVSLVAGESDPALTPLDYTLSGPSVESLLLQQTDKSWLLFLWQEVPCYNLSTRTDIPNPDVQVNVSFGKSFPVYIYKPYVQPEPLDVISSTTNLSVSVGDHPCVLRIG